jgi:hypothetical protein
MFDFESFKCINGLTWDRGDGFLLMVGKTNKKKFSNHSKCIGVFIIFVVNESSSFIFLLSVCQLKIWPADFCSLIILSRWFDRKTLNGS